MQPDEALYRACAEAYFKTLGDPSALIDALAAYRSERPAFRAVVDVAYRAGREQTLAELDRLIRERDQAIAERDMAIIATVAEAVWSPDSNETAETLLELVGIAAPAYDAGRRRGWDGGYQAGLQAGTRAGREQAAADIRARAEQIDVPADLRGPLVIQRRTYMAAAALAAGPYPNDASTIRCTADDIGLQEPAAPAQMAQDGTAGSGEGDPVGAGASDTQRPTEGASGWLRDVGRQLTREPGYHCACGQAFTPAEMATHTAELHNRAREEADRG